MQICLLLSEEEIKTARSLLFAELAGKEILKELVINEWYIQFESSQMWVTRLEDSERDPDIKTVFPSRHK